MLLAGPVSHTSTQYIDFVEILNISLDLSTINFAHFSGCRASFVYSCHSILECCVMFSGVRLSMRSFVLFIGLLRCLKFLVIALDSDSQVCHKASFSFIYKMAHQKILVR